MDTREDGKPAHIWITGKEAGFPPKSRLYKLHMCKNCGVLQGNPLYPETPCKGKVKINLR
ncbi:hypothetical protein ADP65_00016 [Achromobacter phage phiAxp-3]|uniref:Uncharacterized protein n=1 Tax=Achromobacter phage phiAxp-3 TaxID=1664247 RepID=A0A0K2FI86_9CAUD|nr:hypothetical protein ADP65_00016 [Achromobacter phage phiAxp-3]ALA45485.1 hypothetical protein ADP65_00016 [Achromobacter phage phiAxp-3]